MIGLKTKEPANIFLLGEGPGLFYLPHESFGELSDWHRWWELQVWLMVCSREKIFKATCNGLDLCFFCNRLFWIQPCPVSLNNSHRQIHGWKHCEVLLDMHVVCLVHCRRGGLWPASRFVWGSFAVWNTLVSRQAAEALKAEKFR